MVRTAAEIWSDTEGGGKRIGKKGRQGGGSGQRRVGRGEAGMRSSSHRCKELVRVRPPGPIGGRKGMARGKRGQCHGSHKGEGA
jgi:hypothetical protein